MSLAIVLLAIANIFQAACIYNLRKDVDTMIRIMPLQSLMEISKKLDEKGIRK